MTQRVAISQVALASPGSLIEMQISALHQLNQIFFLKYPQVICVYINVWDALGQAGVLSSTTEAPAENGDYAFISVNVNV